MMMSIPAAARPATAKAVAVVVSATATARTTKTRSISAKCYDVALFRLSRRSNRVDLEGQSRTRYRSFSSSSSSSSLSSSSSSSSPPPKLDDVNPERIQGIQVNPKSIGSQILPGNLIYKTYKWSGNTRKVPLELVHGYFWMVSDLRATNQKPTLSNQSLIPKQHAQRFPTLSNVRLLSDLEDNTNPTLTIPSYFVSKNNDGHEAQAGGEGTDALRNNKNTSRKNKREMRSKSKAAVTLLGVAFRDNGFKLLKSWMEPFDDEFRTTSTGSSDGSQVKSYTLSITERWILYPFRNILMKAMRQNTPQSQHSKTMVCFTNGKGGGSSGTGGNELDDFRDVLRIHNLMTGYVFLLDQHGRVRFAGSGLATDDDIKLLNKFTYEIMNE